MTERSTALPLGPQYLRMRGFESHLCQFIDSVQVIARNRATKLASLTVFITISRQDAQRV